MAQPLAPRWALFGMGLAAAMAAQQEAQGAGYAVREQGGAGQAESFAGATARADDPSTVYFNPAGMTRLNGVQVSVVGSYIMPSARIESASASRANVLGRTPITGSFGDAGRDAFVPASYAVAPLGDRMRIGIAVNAPWGLVTEYEPGSIVRYHAMRSELRTINVTPAIAFRVTDNFSIGAGLQFQHVYAELTNAVDFGSIAVLNGLGRFGFRPGSADGRSRIEGDDFNLGFVLGAHWEPIQGTRLGLSFRSAVHHELQGTATFSGVPSLLAPSFRATSAMAKVTTPETVNFGIAQDIGREWTVLLDVQWTNWSRFRELRVGFGNRPDSVTHQRWDDSWWVALGANWRPAAVPGLTLRAGVAYDQSPVPAETRTPRIPDSDRTWLSFGASYQVTNAIEIAAGYTHVFARRPSVNLRDEGPGTADFLRGNLTARYDASVDIIAIQARVRF